MKHIKERFVKILRIELEDLREDIEQLIDECKHEMEHPRHNEYVYLENLAVLKNELLGLGHFARILDEIDVEADADLDAVIAHIKTSFTTEIERCGLAPAAIRLVERKIEKVRKFVET
ncbi:MAG: hypothetical protein ACYTGB_18890 [Planctomycetota bacterium]